MEESNQNIKVVIPEKKSFAKEWASDQKAFKGVPWGKAMMWIFLVSDTFVFSIFLISYMTVRFSTKAESKFYKSTGADIIGMTLVPECQLAREAQICYASISTVTDYDVWAEKPVTAKEVIETLSKNVELTKKLLTELIDKIPISKSCACEKALEEAEF